jgi:hypothetical protein
MRSNYLALVLVLCVIGAYARHLLVQAPWSAGTLPPDKLTLAVEPLRDLSGKTLQELGQLRVDSLTKEKGLKALVPPSYSLKDSPCWNQLQDGVSWEGVEGTFGGTAATQGQVFAQGASLESSVLLNPWILAQLRSHYGVFGVKAASSAEWGESETPREAIFDGPARTVRVSYLHKGRMPEYYLKEGAVYNLNLINARDLGFQSFAVLSSGTAGFDPIKNFQGHTFIYDQRYPLSQHYGVDPVPGSSAKLGNLYYGDEVVILRELPATLRIGFWLNSESADKAKEPDFFEELTVDNESERGRESLNERDTSQLHPP